MSVEEVELIQRLKSGDEGAFEELFRGYKDRVFNVAYRMLGDREAAEDVTQEVFLKVFRKVKGFKGRSSLYTWIYRLTVNLCTDYIRKQDAHPVESLEESEALQLAAEGTPEEEAIRRERAAAVQMIIGSLPDRLRSVIVLREIEGLSYREIAEVLGCSVGRVKSLLHEARAELKRRVQEKRHLFFEEGV